MENPTLAANRVGLLRPVWGTEPTMITGRVDTRSRERAQESDVDKASLLARCRLAEAKRWFAHRGWQVLPQGIRGQSILRWGADHAWLAASGNSQTSVRRWCRKWAPWLTAADQSELFDYLKDSNKKWSADQSACVLEISVMDRTKLKLRHIGADDDPNYEARLGIHRDEAAVRARKYRLKHRTGAKRGRPALPLSQEELLTRRRAQDAQRAKRYRASRKNASRDIKNIDSMTELSVTEFQSHWASDPPPPWAIERVPARSLRRRAAQAERRRSQEGRHDRHSTRRHPLGR
jgi:hypothetical protein